MNKSIYILASASKAKYFSFLAYILSVQKVVFNLVFLRKKGVCSFFLINLYEEKICIRRFSLRLKPDEIKLNKYSLQPENIN
jgi:hypothetical protein